MESIGSLLFGEAFFSFYVRRPKAEAPGRANHGVHVLTHCDPADGDRDDDDEDEGHHDDEIVLVRPSGARLHRKLRAAGQAATLRTLEVGRPCLRGRDAPPLPKG